MSTPAFVEMSLALSNLRSSLPEVLAEAAPSQAGRRTDATGGRDGSRQAPVLYLQVRER